MQYVTDAGWEHLGELGSWQYFCIPAEGDHQPEIYTDAASKIKKYERVLTILVIFQPIYLVVLNINNVLNHAPLWLTIGKLVLWLIIVSAFSFSIVKIIMRIQELKKTIKQ
ncbi:MAG TPA: hypothetical protein DF984_00805 [Anaerolineaceae bacterium]|nr:hypothetical protein [Anaerolineaceae bacterium]